MSTREQFLAEVEAYLKAHDMDPSNLGILALRNPAFVMRLRAGMDVRVSTMDRVQKWMREHPLDRKRKKAAEHRSAA